MPRTASQRRYDARIRLEKALKRAAEEGVEPGEKHVVQDPKTGQFLKGNVSNPEGGPKGPRAKLTQILSELAETVVGSEKSLALFRKEMKKRFEKDPVMFVKTLIAPFLPRNIKLEHITDAEMPVRLIFEVVDNGRSQKKSDPDAEAAD